MTFCGLVMKYADNVVSTSNATEHPISVVLKVSPSDMMRRMRIARTAIHSIANRSLITAFLVIVITHG